MCASIIFTYERRNIITFSFVVLRAALCKRILQVTLLRQYESRLKRFLNNISSLPVEPEMFRIGRFIFLVKSRVNFISLLSVYSLFLRSDTLLLLLLYILLSTLI